MTSRDEALRALETKWRSEVLDLPEGSTVESVTARGLVKNYNSALIACADEIAKLIESEAAVPGARSDEERRQYDQYLASPQGLASRNTVALERIASAAILSARQEVAPVAWIRPDGVTTSDEGLARHWVAQGLQHRPLVYGDTSPAQTSEARDAARKEAYDMVDDFLRDSLGDEAYAKYSDALEIACGYQDAAMRQEAGNG